MGGSPLSSWALADLRIRVPLFHGQLARRGARTQSLSCMELGDLFLFGVRRVF